MSELFYQTPSESGPECVRREILEECGIDIPAKLFVFLETDTRPSTRNKGHITLRYLAIIDKNTKGIDTSHFDEIGTTGGEENEVEERKWIDIDDVQDYEWAFNHADVLERISQGLRNKSLIKFYNKNKKNGKRLY